MGYGDWMRTAPRLSVLAAVLAAGVGAGGACALGQGGVGSSVTGTVRPGTIVTATSTPAGPPKGTVTEQTHPSVLPRTGGARTRFAVRLTLADAPGHTGVLATAYRLQLSVPAKHAISRCSPAAPTNIDSGIARRVVRVALIEPTAGWCTGRYTLTVLLQRGPYCPKPSAGAPPTPCPEFAERDLNVGEAHFIVTTRH